jgi:hypothetical protein
MKNVLLISALSLILFSCHREKPAEIIKRARSTSFKLYEDFSALKVGNYWVYQNFSTDTSGKVLSYNGRIDSCYISADTVFRGRTWYKLHANGLTGTPYTDSWIADSLHYRINSSGTVFYSSEDFTTIFRNYTEVYQQDTIYTGKLKMAHKDSLVLVPAGSFRTIDCEGTFQIKPKYVSGRNPKYNHTIYGWKVGAIYEDNSFISNNMKMGRSLIRYKVK